MQRRIIKYGDIYMEVTYLYEPPVQNTEDVQGTPASCEVRKVVVQSTDITDLVEAHIPAIESVIITLENIDHE